MKLTCTLTGASPDYGTVYVDENMNLIHAPAEADANDTLHLENCILSVETPNNEYHLDGNVLSVVRHRLNGSMTAEAWVYTAAPEKLVEFKYDSNGLRTQKKVTDHGQVVVTEYIYHGKLLIYMSVTYTAWRNNRQYKMHFFYDDRKQPEKVEFCGIVYDYLYNLQGDIIGVLDEIGNSIVMYRYDAWGRIPNSTNALAELLGRCNPYRYRTYIYDEETKLYWLNSRYYNPELNRFICPDIHIGHAGIISNNQYTYCKSNPIMYSDPSGKFPRLSEIWFAMRHPFIARAIGSVIEGKREKNISTTAVRFSIGLGLTNPDCADGEGTQVNAVRHAVWTGIIKSRYGNSIAREAVRSHEDNSILEYEDEFLNMTSSEVMLKRFDSHYMADGICDILNNEIMLQQDLEGMDGKEVCKKVLDIYHETGLWVIDNTPDGPGFGIYLQRLSDAEYNTALSLLSGLDEYGLSD